MAFKFARAQAAIPPKSDRTVQRAYDANRNKIERLFGRLKHYRRLATGSEKRGRNYLAMVYVAVIMTLLR